MMKMVEMLVAMEFDVVQEYYNVFVVDIVVVADGDNLKWEVQVIVCL